MTRVLYLVLWCSFFPVLSADGPPMDKAGDGASEKKGEKNSTEKKPAEKRGADRRGPSASAANRPVGVIVEHSVRTLAEADRTPEGEVRAILSTTAVLKVDRPLRYRTTVLAPGSYPLKVTGEGDEGTGRNLFFVIGPATGAAPAAVKSEPAAPEEKRLEKSPEARGGEKRGEPKAGGKRGASKSIPGQIRALFHLTAAKEAASRVELTVRPNARGDRFTLMVKAGASEGKATLKLGGE